MIFDANQKGEIIGRLREDIEENGTPVSRIPEGSPRDIKPFGWILKVNVLINNKNN